jgi:acetylornithine deacetylase/succinyl-diaminopimelate desuccinylase-like protein
MMYTELEKNVIEYIEQNSDELFRVLSELIQIDSQNFRNDGREQKCAEYVRDLYQNLGLEVDFYCPDSLPGFTEHPAYMPGRNTANRPNVSGIWRTGPENMGNLPVMLAAHTDTMPAGDLSKWTYDPFGGIITDNRIYGLGAGDNKAGIAASYFAVKALMANSISLNTPVILTAYCDEEYGGGNGTLAACLKYPCKTYVNLDGGNYEMWTIAVGGGGFRIDLKKKETTDSMMDLYHVLVELMNELKVFMERRKAELHNNPLYIGTDMERSAFRLTKFHCDSLREATVAFVIYTDKSKEEIQTELKDILHRLEPVFDKYGIETSGFRPTTRYFRYGETDKSDGGVEIMTRAASQVAGYPVVEKGSCLTDLSLFLEYGSPHSFNFGIFRDFALPGGAHQPDEYVDCTQFTQYTQALALFLIRYCGICY